MVGSNDISGENKLNQGGDFTSTPNDRVAERQKNIGQQGIDGMFAGVQSDDIAHKTHIEEKKKRNDRLSHVSMSLALEQAYQAIEDEISGMKKDTEEADLSFKSMSDATVDIVAIISAKNIELNNKLTQLKEELARMKEAGATQEEIAEKTAEIEYTAKSVELLTDTIVSTTKQYGDAKTAMEEARETIAQLELQKEIARNSDNPEAALRDIQAQIDAAKSKLEGAEQLIAQADSQRKAAVAVIEATNNLEHVAGACGPIEQDKGYLENRTHQFNARSELITALKDSIADNRITQAKLDIIKENLNMLSAEDGARVKFIAALGKSGIEVEDADGKIHKGSAAETIIQGQLGGELALNVPEYNLDEYDKAYNDALAAVEVAALEGGTISKEDYDKILSAPGMSEEKLSYMMAQNDVELEGAKPTIANASLSREQEPAVILQEPIIISSFADSEQFAATNDPNAPVASYNEPINNHVDNTPSLTVDAFGEDPTALAARKAKLEEEEQRIALERLNNINLMQPNAPQQGNGSGQMS